MLAAQGHILVTGGPGSGKTTISTLKAADIVEKHLKPGQSILFLSFARATVSRVIEAIEEETAISPEAKKRIEVDTYHSFFWQITKTHGYLIGFPRKLSLLTPPAEAIALAQIRRGYKAANKLTQAERKDKSDRETAERLRLAKQEGRVCFSLFASSSATILHGSEKVRKLISNAYPFVILDEFQDTDPDQWRVVQALGKHSTLSALADPEQRIFDFIGADPERLNHFRDEFKPTEVDLAGDNHRSKGTEISLFGNDILTGKFTQKSYNGVQVVTFQSNENQALAALTVQTLETRKRLIDSVKKRRWSLAILVPTKRMTRMVSDAFRAPFGNVPPITHSAVVDMEGAILGAELIALLMQPDFEGHLTTFIDSVCAYFQGKDGDTPTQKGFDTASSIRKAFEKCNAAAATGKPFPKGSIFVAMNEVYRKVLQLKMAGDPDADWRSVRRILEEGDCPRLNDIAQEIRNLRLLDRGTQLRQALAQDWRDNGAYENALEIVRLAFVQEHFSAAHKPESGVNVMNMHKAKGKQFDEVIIFEGWPIKINGKIMANTDRILRANVVSSDISQARQNFRVSVTRAKQRATIMTPDEDICRLLL